MGYTYLPFERQQDRIGYVNGIMEVATEHDIHGIETVATRFDELRLDSLDFIDFINAIDDKFTVEIPADAAAKFETVGDLVDWLEGKDKAPFEFTKANGEEFFDDGRYKP